MAQDYWRGGWANGGMLPGTRAAMTAKQAGGSYGPLNALADILGAYWQKKDMDKRAEGYGKLMEPVNVNTGEVVSTPQFDMGTIQGAGAGGYGNNPQDVSLMPQSGFGSEGYQLPPSTQAQSPQMPQATPQMQGAMEQPTPQQVASQQSGEAPGQYTPPAPQQSQADGLEQGFGAFDGATMDNGRVGCAEAVGKVGSWFSPFYKSQAENQVYWVPTMVENAQKAGYQVTPFDPNNVERGDGIIYGDGDHIMIADGQGGAYGNSSNALGPSGPGAVVHGGNLGDYGQPTAIIKTSRDLQTQNLGQPYQQGIEGQLTQNLPQDNIGISMPKSKYYAPPERQLHQATKEQPWTDTPNTKERIKAAYDSAWAAKMKDIVANYPELLQDKEAMNNIMAMREQGYKQLLGDWQETQFKSGLANFQRNLASGDMNRAMYEGYRDGLDPTMMKTLADPEWDSSLVNFGGSQKIVSKNKRTGEFLVNGKTPTAQDLKETMTAAQERQFNNVDRQFNYNVAKDARDEAYRADRAAAEDAYRAAVLADREERTSKARDYSNPNSSGQDSKELKQRLSGLRTRIAMLKQLHPRWKYEIEDVDEQSEDWVKELRQAIEESISLSDQLGIKYQE